VEIFVNLGVAVREREPIRAIVITRGVIVNASVRAAFQATDGQNPATMLLGCSIINTQSSEGTGSIKSDVL
jgi:hypothetical protein